MDAAARDWGPSALADQNLAGIVMWLGGDGLMMVIMIVVAGQWVRTGDRDSSLGPWLDGIRSRSLLGETGTTTDIDGEQAALDAYNARMAELNGPRSAAGGGVRTSARPATSTTPATGRTGEQDHLL